MATIHDPTATQAGYFHRVEAVAGETITLDFRLIDMEWSEHGLTVAVIPDVTAIVTPEYTLDDDITAVGSWAETSIGEIDEERRDFHICLRLNALRFEVASGNAELQFNAVRKLSISD